MGCTRKPPCVLRPVPLDQISIEWNGPAVGRKALSYPATKRIFIDQAFWDSLKTVEARRAILAHEQGHIEGAKCEDCADRRAGQILRDEGYPNPRDGARALAGRLENRDGKRAAKQLLEGFGLDLPDPAGGYLLAQDRIGDVSDETQAWADWLDANGLVVDGVRYRLGVTENGGRRTSPGVQLGLYAQGRAVNADGEWRIVDPSKVVTNARTLQETKHGQGKALDTVVVMPDGRWLFNPTTPSELHLYERLGEEAERFGRVWGGRWKTAFRDLDHTEDGAGVLFSVGAPILLGLAFAFILGRL